MESQLSLIGGTMGLLTGFSLLSAVEIVYFAIKFFLSLRLTKADVIVSNKNSGKAQKERCSNDLKSHSNKYPLLFAQLKEKLCSCLLASLSGSTVKDKTLLAKISLYFLRILCFT
jgi:hypothetical protein